MKKILSLLVVILLLVACSISETTVATSDTQARFTSETFFDHSNSNVHIIKDTETGCKYLIASEFQAGYGTAITPLLKSDGTPNCDK